MEDKDIKKQTSPSESQSQTNTISDEINPQNQPGYSSLNSINQVSNSDLSTTSQSKTAQLTPLSPKKRKFRMKNILILLLVFILLIILYFPATMLVRKVSSIIKYDSAARECGKPPVVITFVGGFMGGVERTYYLPEQQDYAAKKYQPFFAFFATSYDIYYVCNEADVAKKFPKLIYDIQKALTEQEQIAKKETQASADVSSKNKILEEFDKANFSYFYPNPLPPDFKDADVKYRYSNFQTENGVKVYRYVLDRTDDRMRTDRLMIIEADSLDYKSPYLRLQEFGASQNLSAEKNGHLVSLIYLPWSDDYTDDNGSWTKGRARSQKLLEQVMTTLVPNRDRAVSSKVAPDEVYFDPL